MWRYMRKKIQQESRGTQSCETVTVGVVSSIKAEDQSKSHGTHYQKADHGQETAGSRAGVELLAGQSRKIAGLVFFWLRPERALILLILGYQKLISPWLPPSCRYVPTCSQYAIEALKLHGVWKGSLLAIWRVMRCHPFIKGGYDPVPPRQKQTQAK